MPYEEKKVDDPLEKLQNIIPVIGQARRIEGLEKFLNQKIFFIFSNSEIKPRK
jgi:hypothetical protein